jgi:hypothetical protein
MDIISTVFNLVATFIGGFLLGFCVAGVINLVYFIRSLKEDNDDDDD